MMLRAQLIATFAILLLAVAGSAVFLHQDQASQLLERDAEATLNRAATIAEHERRLSEYSLLLKAQYVASGSDVTETIQASYEGTEEEPRDPEQQKYEQHVAVHQRLIKYDKEFELYDQGAGKGVEDIDLPLQWSRPVKTDLFFIVDERGVGLAAFGKGKDLYKWYGVDVSKDYPLISEAMVKNEPRTAFMRYSFEPKADNKPMYQVAVAPIRVSRLGKPIGAVIMGNLVNDGSAQKVRDLITKDKDWKPSSDDPVEASRQMAQRKALAPEVAFFRDGKIVGSTLATKAQAAVASELFENQKILGVEGRDKTITFEFEKDLHMAKARYLLGQQGEEKPTGVILMTNLSAFSKPMTGPMTTTIFIALGALLLGIILIFVFVQLFISPLARLESGVGEVVAGNKDHVFEQKGHRFAQGFAHQLNLMSAYLQGKPMPDADDVGGWGDDLGGSKPAGAPKVGGVSMSDLMGQKPKND